MNFTPTTIIAALAVVLLVPYLIIVLKRLSNNFPFSKALNPSYTKEMQEADALKKSISPIMHEIETQRVAKFVKYWSAKFENQSLTAQDVENLNAMAADGALHQVNGILAIHPEGRMQYNQINDQLKSREEALVAEKEIDAVLA